MKRLLAFLPFTLSLSASPMEDSLHSFKILKPFGFAWEGQKIAPNTVIEVTDAVALKKEDEEILFVKGVVSSEIHSFPTDSDLLIVSFGNFFRKEIYKKTNQFLILTDFTPLFDLNLGDIISLYLYDSDKKVWVNPLLSESLGGSNSLVIRGNFVGQKGVQRSFNSHSPVTVEEGDLSLIVQTPSALTGRIEGLVGAYSLRVVVNGEEFLSFTAQAIEQVDDSFEWVDLDLQKGSFEEGIFVVKNLPLKVGQNEVRVEVKNFLYQSLIFRGFIKVLGPLVH